MHLGVWSDLLRSLFDPGTEFGHEVPGTDLSEWLLLVLNDYDDIDREHYLETIGGG